MARSSYPEPAVPGKFSSWVTKKSTTERVQDRRPGQTRRRAVDCWDVQGRADGVLWAKRFRRAGLARTWKERLDAGYAAGLAFDPRTKQFVNPLANGFASRGPGDAVDHGSSTADRGGTAVAWPMVRLSAHRDPSGRQWLTHGPPGTVPVGGQASGSSKIVR